MSMAEMADMIAVGQAWGSFENCRTTLDATEQDHGTRFM
jgi:hypothetical protein